MKLVRVPIFALAGLLGTAAGVQHNDFQANLIGFREVPPNSTVASGKFKAEIINDSTIAYQLTYSGLEANVTQAHIHFGQRFVAAGIALWLCQTDAVPAPESVRSRTPPCPAEAQGNSTVTGNLTAADVIGPAGQGIAPGEFAEILKAIRAGVTYANVHSSKFPTGEIRGQIRAVETTDGTGTTDNTSTQTR